MTILADGQVSTTQSTLYEVGSAVLSAKVEKVTFFNTNVADQTAILFVKSRFGTPRKVRQFIMPENNGGEYLEPGEFLPLGNGDSLEAITTTAVAVDFIVFGSEVRA